MLCFDTVENWEQGLSIMLGPGNEKTELEANRQKFEGLCDADKIGVSKYAGTVNVTICNGCEGRKFSMS